MPASSHRAAHLLAPMAVAALAGLFAGACADDGNEVTSTGAGDAPPPAEGAGPAGPSTLAPTCASLEPTVAVDGPLSSDPALAAAQTWRAEMGFRSDEAWVSAVPSLPTTTPEAESFGFPLTDDETNDLMGRGGTDDEIAATTALADQHPATFGGRWIDNAAGGVLTVAFTAELDARQADLDAQLGPGVVRVVEVERTLAELTTMQSDVTDLLDAEGVAWSGTGVSETLNVVSVFLSVLDDASVAPLVERFGTDALCVEGADPAAVIPDGPQPEAGDGWRLLADAPGVGEAFRTAVAGDADALAALWAEIGLDGGPPPVDHATELVVWFGPAVSGTCDDVRLDDVVVDADAAVVYPTIVLPGGDRACDDDANPHAYVVAIDRAALPSSFTVQLGPEAVCPGCEGSDVTPVTLDP